jgi:hypothetical protein
MSFALMMGLLYQPQMWADDTEVSRLGEIAD